MKKIVIILFLIIYFPINVTAAAKKDSVTLSNCVDSNSARFMLGLNEIKVKFIGMESDDVIKLDDKDFSLNDYVCSLLKKSKKITLEYEASLDKDEFGRVQAWVWIDDSLFQENLIKNGYVDPAFIYEDYKYYNNTHEALMNAKDNQLGIWKKEKIEEPKVEEPKKDRNFFEKIIDFIVDIFNKLIDFINKLIREIF